MTKERLEEILSKVWRRDWSADDARDVIWERLAALENENGVVHHDLKMAGQKIAALEAALVKLRDCDWTITLPDRMDAVRQIAREALNAGEPQPSAKQEKG